MSIFDVFTFKKKFAEVATKENFEAIKEVARESIIEQIKEKIPGEEKMNNVIDNVIAFINSKINSDNKIVQWIIDNILIPDVRTICQAVYDLLKEIVKGL